MRRMLLLVACLSCSPLAYSSDLYTGRYSTCMNESGGVTVNMINCINEELGTQDARLNGAYEKLRGELSAERRKQLLKAQRLWIQYTDANCQFYATAGGSLAMVAANECMLRETAERAQELENMY